MTSGSNQGLFVIVAVVIFGIFVSISYLLFQDKLSVGLSTIFEDSMEQAKDNLSPKIKNSKEFMLLSQAEYFFKPSDIKLTEVLKGTEKKINANDSRIDLNTIKQELNITVFVDSSDKDLNTELFISDFSNVFDGDIFLTVDKKTYDDSFNIKIGSKKIAFKVVDNGDKVNIIMKAQDVFNAIPNDNIVGKKLKYSYFNRNNISFDYNISDIKITSDTHQKNIPINIMIADMYHLP